MAKETKDGKVKAAKEPQTEVPSECGRRNGAGGAAGARTAIDDRDRRHRGCPRQGHGRRGEVAHQARVPRAMAYQMVAARFHQNVVTDGEGGGPEFENSHWNDR